MTLVEILREQIVELLEEIDDVELLDFVIRLLSTETGK